MVTPAVRWRRVVGPIARHGRQERTVARVWALLAFLVFVGYRLTLGPIETPDEPGDERVLQVLFALGGRLAIGVAWRSELAGGLLLTASAVSLGVVAEVAFPPTTAFIVALFYLGPGLLFLADWASRHVLWQDAILAVAVVLGLSAGGLAAQQVHDYCFGPEHPESTLVTLSDSPVEWAWAGAVTTRSAQVNARLRAESTRVRLAVSADPTFAAPSYSEAAAASEAGGRMVALPVRGLEPATRYHYAIEVDGALDLVRAGSFATFAEGPQSLVVAFASCARFGSNGAVFDAIREARPDLYLALGDLHYANIQSNNPARFRHALGRQLTAPAQAALFREVPIGYVSDDHDFAGNDSSAFSPSREAARLSYRESVPHYPTVAGDGDAPIHQAFTGGRVRVILTDGRSVRGLDELPGGEPSMLGAAQREWLLAELVEASSSHALVVWGNPQPWTGAESAGADHWGGGGTLAQAADRGRCRGAVDAHVRLAAHVHLGVLRRRHVDGRGRVRGALLRPLEADAPVRVVAVGPVLAGAAAAERQPRLRGTRRAVRRRHGQPAAQQQRAARDRHHRGLGRRGLRLAAALVAQRAGRAAPHGVGDRLGVGGLEVDPRPAPRIEDGGQRAQADPRVDAALGLPRHGDLVAAVLARRHGPSSCARRPAPRRPQPRAPRRGVASRREPSRAGARRPRGGPARCLAPPRPRRRRRAAPGPRTRPASPRRR